MKPLGSPGWGSCSDDREESKKYPWGGNTRGEGDSFCAHRRLVPRTQVKLALIQLVKDRAGLRPLSSGSPYSACSTEPTQLPSPPAGVGETRLED